MRSRLSACGPLDGSTSAITAPWCRRATRTPDGALYASHAKPSGPNAGGRHRDLHANISQRMMDSADAIISYRTNTHVDRRERSAEAATHAQAEGRRAAWKKPSVHLPMSHPP